MTASLRKGWCPSLLNPMESGDGYLARVKPAAATISSGAARAVAVAAERFGNGLVDITNRCNLQFRGFALEDVRPFAETVIKQGLAHREIAQEQARNVAASALGPDDRSADFDAHLASRAIETMLASNPEMTALPGKFGFSVDGGGLLPLGDVGADVLFHADHGEILAGLCGSPMRARCTEAEIAEVAKKLAAAFLELSDDLDEKPRRMRYLVDAIGAEAIFLKAGIAAEKNHIAIGNDPIASIGFNAFKNESVGFFAFGLPFGQCDMTGLSALADLSDRFGDSIVRLTPWRSLVIAGVAVGDAAGLAQQGAAAGFITNVQDQRRLIVACPGLPACSSASVSTRSDAATLAASGVVGADMVHVSGCIKGCARPRPAPITLAGDEGAYRVILDGRADDAPQCQGLGIDDVITFLLDAQRSASA